MVKNIQGIINRKPLLSLALIAVVLLAGLFMFSHVGNVEGKGATLGVCYNNAPNGYPCNTNSQCSSGLCVGASGSSCVAGETGTCQSVSLGDFKGYVPSGVDDGSGGGSCTQESPVPPSSISASFSGLYDSNGQNYLNITVPAGVIGDSQQIAVIGANQSFSSTLQPMWWSDNGNISGWTGTVSLGTSQGYIGQSIKVGVRNFKNCGQLWSAWTEYTVPVQASGSGGVYSCTGTPASNSDICSGDDTGLSSNTAWSLKQSCGAPKCERTCSQGYAYSGGSCVLVQYSCTGNIVSNASLCSGDGTGLNATNGIYADVPHSLKTSCSSPSGSVPKCETTCNSGWHKSGNACVQDPTPTAGNVYGSAWSSNIGWIKMNSCEDVAPFDGLPDNGCVSTYGVRINNTNNNNVVNIPSGAGVLSGHAWSSGVGWIQFGGGLSGFPNGAGTSAVDAELLPAISPAKPTTFRGWARALTAQPTADQASWDGWLSLAGTNFPSGILDGTRGVTYIQNTARIVGSAWGGEVLGWVSFSGPTYQVTYGKPINTFDYHLTVNKPGVTIPLNGPVDKSMQVNVIMDSSPAQSVQLVPIVPNVPQLTVAVHAGDSCIPSSGTGICTKSLDVNVGSQTPVGSYIIQIKGVSQDLPDKFTSFKVTTNPGAVVSVEDIPLTASCGILNPAQPPYFVNSAVTWTSTPIGGESPYTYVWKDAFNNSSPFGLTQDVSKTYSTTGIKQASVEIRDSANHLYTCTTPTITVIVKPNINEF